MLPGTCTTPKLGYFFWTMNRLYRFWLWVYVIHILYFLLALRTPEVRFPFQLIGFYSVMRNTKNLFFFSSSSCLSTASVPVWTACQAKEMHWNESVWPSSQVSVPSRLAFKLHLPLSCRIPFIKFLFTSPSHPPIHTPFAFLNTWNMFLSCPNMSKKVKVRNRIMGGGGRTPEMEGPL